MKKTNGFTLIELLAVIAILAIILLIAVPMVLSTISSSKNSAAVKSAQFAWEAGDLYLASQASTGTIPTTVSFAQATPYLTGAGTSVTAATYTVTNGAVSAIAAVAVTSGGTSFTCSGASKGAITCS